jgi:hypothetical protein
MSEHGRYNSSSGTAIFNVVYAFALAKIFITSMNGSQCIKYDPPVKSMSTTIMLIARGL